MKQRTHIRSLQCLKGIILSFTDTVGKCSVVLKFICILRCVRCCAFYVALHHSCSLLSHNPTNFLPKTKFMSKFAYRLPQLILAYQKFLPIFTLSIQMHLVILASFLSSVHMHIHTHTYVNCTLHLNPYGFVAHFSQVFTAFSRQMHTTLCSMFLLAMHFASLTHSPLLLFM